ncbi:MAG: pantetheine-phosphate adenylyltransferase [Thermodesulfobacteriota bacterium]
MSDYQPFVSPDLPYRLAVYPGTFDPITNGHLDIIQRALMITDRLVVAVAESTGKSPLFDLKERLAMARACFGVHEDRIEVASFSGLLVDFAYTRGARIIIRGLRAVSDFEYEFQLALMNRRLEREVETVFLMTGFRWIYISSSIIKEAARFGGDVSGLVPDHVCEALRRKYLAGPG